VGWDGRCGGGGRGGVPRTSAVSQDAEAAIHVGGVLIFLLPLLPYTHYYHRRHRHHLYYGGGGGDVVDDDDDDDVAAARRLLIVAAAAALRVRTILASKNSISTLNPDDPTLHPNGFYAPTPGDYPIYHYWSISIIDEPSVTVYTPYIGSRRIDAQRPREKNMIFFRPSSTMLLYIIIYTDATVRVESEAGASYMFANVNIARNTYINAHFICIRKY